MIVVIGRAVTDASRRAELIQVGQAVAAASRAEEGCIGYRMYEDTEIENEFVFVEEWDSQEALDTHFRTQHVAQFMAAVPATLAAPPDVKFHTIAGTVDLADINAGA
jgi:quinol monooxygenase YgiN